jgi:hypothetical protein
VEEGSREQGWKWEYMHVESLLLSSRRFLKLLPVSKAVLSYKTRRNESSIANNRIPLAIPLTIDTS